MPQGNKNKSLTFKIIVNNQHKVIYEGDENLYWSATMSQWIIDRISPRIEEKTSMPQSKSQRSMPGIKNCETIAKTIGR
jgi:hypothetical protein